MFYKILLLRQGVHHGHPIFRKRRRRRRAIARHFGFTLARADGFDSESAATSKEFRHVFLDLLDYSLTTYTTGISNCIFYH